MATRQQHRQREEHEAPQATAFSVPVGDISPLDFSTLRNLPQTLPAPTPPEPLVGEVKAGASDPAQEDTVSVLANKPDHNATVAMPAEVTGEVAAGANRTGEVPPSLQGTSQAPQPQGV